MHALTAGAKGRTIHIVDGLVVILRTALWFSIKRSLSLLHLRTRDPIGLLVTRGPRMIRILPSRLIGVLGSL